MRGVEGGLGEIVDWVKELKVDKNRMVVFRWEDGERMWREFREDGKNGGYGEWMNVGLVMGYGEDIGGGVEKLLVC